MNRKLQFNRLVSAMLVVSMLLSVGMVQALPGSFTLSGVLQDDTGNPLPNASDVPARIVFYESETSADQLETVITSCTITRGVFTASVILPTNLLMVTELWYTLAIDTTRNGFDSDDLFEGRFAIRSAPFALNAPPVSFFNTHGGWTTTNTGVNFTPSRVEFAVFTTPPGGVEFDAALFRMASGGNITGNFAIYDAQGLRLYSPGPFVVGLEDQVLPRVHTSEGSSQPVLYMVEMQGILAPSSTYFVAFVTTTAGVGHYPASYSFWPLAGGTPLMSTNAELPATVNLQDVPNGLPFNLTLLKLDNERKTGLGLSKVGESKTGASVFALGTATPGAQ
jgi:hypothetical protein